MESATYFGAQLHAEEERKEAYHEWGLATQINYAEGSKPMAERVREGIL